MIAGKNYVNTGCAGGIVRRRLAGKAVNGGRMTIPYIPAQRSVAPVSADWRAYAACRRADPRLFFPAGTGEAALVQVERAKQVCADCPVRIPCLDWALATGQRVGVWGGTAEDERRALHAQRARALPGLLGPYRRAVCATTIRVSSTREVTPSLRKIWRRW
jgi:WhiB family transcriptional regulator, redox-sensing transcriptional regulator